MLRFSVLLIAIALAFTSSSAFIRNTQSPLQFFQRGWFATHSTGENHACSHTVVDESVKLLTLYSPLAPHRNATITVDDTHKLFYQEYGQTATNQQALTALFLHGGPGAGCAPNHARFMDPDKYRIILLDQRGSGRSTPRGEAFNKNTLQDLVQDCEKLKIELGISKWDLVLGGSWGTTLALAYAQTYPDSVRSLVLRGVCLMRPCEVDWLFSSKGGAASLDPEGWKNFSSAVGVVEAEDASCRAALHAHYDRLLGGDPVARIYAAKSWMQWEMRASSLSWRYSAQQMNNETTNHPVLVWELDTGWSCQDPQGVLLHYAEWHESHMLRRGVSLAASGGLRKEIIDARPVCQVIVEPRSSNNEAISPSQAAKFIPAQAMLTCFYSVNERYATNNMNLLAEERMERIRRIPCIAIQGGKDTICPPDTALDLLEVWPEMELRIPMNSGHSMYDAAITNEIVRATDRFAEIFSNES